MASLEQRGKTFRVVFRYAGHKFSRALKTDNRKSAVASLARLEDGLQRLEQGLLSLPPGADLLAFLLSDGRLAQRPTAKASLVQTLGQLLDRFLASLTPNSLEPTTERVLRIHSRHFKRVLGERKLLGSFDLAALQQYVDTRALAVGRREQRLSPTTIKKEIATLNMVWTWGRNHDLLDRPLPKAGLRFPKTSDKPPFQTIAEIERKVALGGFSEVEQEELWDSVFLTLPEIDKLLAHVQRQALHPCLYPVFVFAAHTGARRSEICRSQIEDVDFDGKRIQIRERKRVRGRHTLRGVPMSPFLEGVMREWLRDHPGGRFTFCLEPNVPKSTKARLEPIPLTCEEAGHHFQQVLRGTKWEQLRGWHVFRHSFCSNCAAKGVDQRMINAWVAD